MTAKKILAVCIATSGLAWLAGCEKAAPPAPGKPKVSIILTAFGDKDATFGETQPFLKAMKTCGMREVSL